MEKTRIDVFVSDKASYAKPNTASDMRLIIMACLAARLKAGLDTNQSFAEDVMALLSAPDEDIETAFRECVGTDGRSA